MKSILSIKLVRIAFAAFILCTAFSALAQKNSKEYFLPAPKKNKATFDMPDANGKQTKFTRVIYYLNKGEQYEVVDTTWYHGKAIRFETRTIEFTPDEVHLIKLQSTTEREKNKITFYDSPKVILKVPGIGETLTWSYKEANGQKTNFIADWIKFKLNNVNTRAIRVTESITLSSGLLFEAKRIHYYMKGTGLWKMEGETRELQNTICEFVKLEYDSTINHK